MKFSHLLFASILVHFFIFFLLPSPEIKIPKPEFIEVELQTIQLENLPQPEAPVKKTEAVKKTVPEEKKIPVPPKVEPPAKKVPPPSKPVSQRQNAPPQKRSTTPSPVEPKTVAPPEKPTLNLTPSKNAGNYSLDDAKLSSQPVDLNSPRISRISAGNGGISEDLGKLTETRITQPKTHLENSLPKLQNQPEQGTAQPEKNLKPLLNANPQKINAPQATAEKSQNMDGQIQNRQVIYRPPAPALDTEDNTTVSLRITVKPSGEVVEVYPVKKGNPQLEKIGMEYVRKFRFAPVSGNGNQTGIIHFRINRGKIQ